MGILLRVKMIGTGTPQDPNRVNLPTYVHVHGNITQGYAIVSVPDDVHGLSEDDLASEEFDETTEGRLYHSPSPTMLDKVHSHFDEHYKEHAGKFRVEVA